MHRYRPHMPMYYFLDKEGRGKYLIQRGDYKLGQGKIRSAKKYYEEAKVYEDYEAQQRLDKIGRAITAMSNHDTPTSNPNIDLPFNKVDAAPQSQYELTGPYFPHKTISSSTSFSSSSLSSSLILIPNDFLGYSIYNAPSTLTLVNILRNTKDEHNKRSIYTIIHNIIQKYDEDFDSKEKIKELAVLASIPDQDVFIAIINRLLQVERDHPTFPILTLHGLAVILSFIPDEINLQERRGFITNILERLQFRLLNTEIVNNKGELLPLLRAVSALFDVMLAKYFAHISRVDSYDPIKARLEEIATVNNNDCEISFLAKYSIQSLILIRNDESLPMKVFRRGRLAFIIVADIRSLVMNGDLNKFEDIYNNIMEISNVSIKMKWYQGLLFLDILLEEEDFVGFEKYVIKGSLKKDGYFMQGVCLRLEQLASSHPHKDISDGARHFLKDLKLHPDHRIRGTARLVLSRLKGGSKSLSASDFFDLPAPNSTTTSAPNFRQESLNRLEPVWDKVWETDTASLMLKMVQKKERRDSSLTSVAHSMELIAPTITTMDEVKKALKDHYSTELVIKRADGHSLQLKDCYVHLSIFEASSQRQRDEKMLNKQLETYIRLSNKDASANIEKSIPFNEILDRRKLLDGNEGIPKRILVIGRAGVGKTTFCKKLVHDFQENGLWNDRFKAILWIRLRMLKSYRARSLEDLLIEKYFIKGSKNDKEGLAHELMKSIGNNEVLFVLDGLDEFVTDSDTDEGDSLLCFVATLLDMPNAIITTRPYGNDRSLVKNADLELETVGFSKENVKTYVQSVVKSKNKSDGILHFIQRTPLIQGLVNIPVQLDLICLSWKDLVSTNDTEIITITRLYQTITKSLWCNDAVRAKKKINNKMATRDNIKNHLTQVIDSYMRPTTEFLGHLAFQGLENNNMVIYDHATLIYEGDIFFRNRPSESHIIEELKKSSVFHVTDTEAGTDSDESQQKWSFIHLTFQEYYAAKWLSQHLQDEDLGSSESSKSMSRQSAISFIRNNKYNPRYEIVWWMIAGQLEGKSLESYFHLLQEEPRDLIGVRHQLLLAGCYKEARPKLSDKFANQIKSELAQWIQFEMRFPGSLKEGSVIGRQSVFPEEVLVKCLGRPKDDKTAITDAVLEKKGILKAMSHRRYLSAPTIEQLILMTADKDSEIVRLAIEVLGNQSTMPESTIKALVRALYDKDSYVKFESAKALSRKSDLPEKAVDALVATLQDNVLHVRDAAAVALVKQTLPLSKPAILALVGSLIDVDLKRNDAAVYALCNLSILPAYAARILVKVMQDKKSLARSIAADALGNHELSDSTIESLVAALKCEDPNVRIAAAGALGKQLKQSDSMIRGLVFALQDDDPELSVAAVNALVKKSTLSDPIVANELVKTLQDGLPPFKRIITCELGKHPSLPACIIDALVVALKDIDVDVRRAAATTLGQQSMLSASTIKGLVAKLRDPSPVVRGDAATALSQQSAFSESTAMALAQALHDDFPNVRREAAYALCTEFELPSHICYDMVMALDDENEEVRSAIASALSQQPKLAKNPIMALITILLDKDLIGKTDAAMILGYQSSLPDFAIMELVEALSHNDPSVRKIAAEALGSQSALSASTIFELRAGLHDDDTTVRAAAAAALCNQTTLDKATLEALTSALLGKDLSVRKVIALSLAKHPELLESTNTITAALKDEDIGVREAVANALINQPNLSESTTIALVDIVKEKVKVASPAAAEALSKQSTLSVATLLELISAVRSGVSIDNCLVGALSQPKIYFSVADMVENEIEQLYLYALYGYSRDHHVSMYIHEGRLHIYTETGSEQSGELNEEVQEKILTAFRNIHLGGGLDHIPFD